MKKTTITGARLIITPPVSEFWDSADRAHEAEALRDIVQAAVRTFLAHEFPNQVVTFTAYEIAVCTHCRGEWEELTADDVAAKNFLPDEHSIAGEPACCYKAIAEWRAERGIPAHVPAGGVA
ncbi:hypothetical protein [Streptomyces sp. NPDC005953]|uniref:hypothetical protein n=1 Tax=Streptomyces sp. NPDC005953 TaxID=3156719 RepID=UPI0033D69EBF